MTLKELEKIELSEKEIEFFGKNILIYNMPDLCDHINSIKKDFFKINNLYDKLVTKDEDEEISKTITKAVAYFVIKYIKEHFPIIEIKETKKIDTKKILVVEEGSVDINDLEDRGYEVIVYGQGFKPPKFIEIINGGIK